MYKGYCKTATKFSIGFAVVLFVSRLISNGSDVTFSRMIFEIIVMAVAPFGIYGFQLVMLELYKGIYSEGYRSFQRGLQMVILPLIGIPCLVYTFIAIFTDYSTMYLLGYCLTVLLAYGLAVTEDIDY